MTPETDCDDAVGRHQHDDGSDVVHEGPELSLVPAGQLELAALGEVTQAEQDDVLAQPPHGAADHFDEAPTRGGVDPDFDGRAHVLALNGGERDAAPIRGRRGGRGREPDWPCQSSNVRSNSRSAEWFPHTRLPVLSMMTTASGRFTKASAMAPSSSGGGSGACPGAGATALRVRSLVRRRGGSARGVPGQTFLCANPAQPRCRAPLLAASWIVIRLVDGPTRLLSGCRSARAQMHVRVRLVGDGFRRPARWRHGTNRGRREALGHHAGNWNEPARGSRAGTA